MCANALKNGALLQVYYTFGSGGVERVIHNISNALRKEGVSSHLIVIGNDAGRVRPDEFDSITILPVSASPLCRSWRMARSIASVRRLIERNGRRCKLLVHTPGLWAAFLPRDKCDLVFHSIGSEINKAAKPAFADRLRHHLRALAFSRRNVVTVSDGVRADLLQLYRLSPARLRTIRNPVDVASVLRQSKEYIAPVAGKYVLHIGRFNEVKQQEHLLRAASSIDPQLKICFMGDGGDTFRQEVVPRLDSPALAGRVEFLDYHANPYPVINSACCVVLCSRTEAMPMVVIEALILGIPVVSYDSPTGPREIMGRRNPEWLVPINDISTLAKVISAVASEHPSVDVDYYRQRYDAALICRDYLQ
jgi:glycosyltransferase involved in cell wall biosynthesis